MTEAVRDERPARRSGSWRPLVLVGAIGLVVAAVAAGAGGATTPYAIGDPGAVVRWSLPLVRLVHDVAASATVGLLVLAGFLVPETTRTDHRVRAARLAAGTAGVWAAAGAALVILVFSDISGLAVSDPDYGPNLSALVWDLDTTRAQLLSTVVVAAVALGALLVSSKTAIAWLGILSVVAVLPLALAGHAAASRDHMSGVNTLAVHLVAATLWVGGLLALLVMRKELGRHLPVTVARYSVLAGWSYAALLASGVLAAWLGLASVADVVSAYGALIAVKVLALVALGVLGWQQRRIVVARLRERVDSGASTGRPFVRLAVTELVLMGVALGAAVALARTPSPSSDALAPPTSMVYELSGYADPGPVTSNTWWSAWQVDWLWLAVAVVMVGTYLRWYLRLRRRGDAWPVHRPIIWTLGWAVFVYATSGAPGVYGRVLFSGHMVMHMTVAMLVPLLLVPAAPVTLALRALPARPDKTLGPREVLLAVVHSRYLRVVANPVVAAGIFFFSLAIFYFSPLFELALRTHTGHLLMTTHFLMAGYLFVWALVGTDPGPRRWPPLILLVILFATISFHAFFGVVLTGSNTLLAPGFFEVIDLPWVADPVADQRTGGAIAWGVGEAPTLALALMVAVQWLRSDRLETSRLDRQADRDGDAELAAYNAQLARWAEQAQRARGGRA
jgi:cytochrome c oxidase assembly factor CtaG/putative copper export protein